MSFYLLHRGWMDNPIFSNEPFTEKLAWIWLIQEASFEPHRIRYHSKMIEVNRGQVPTSYRKLKEVFQWGNERIRRFLNLLVSEAMILLETGTGFLIITICNYEKYQKPVKIPGTQPGTVVGTESGTQPGTNIKKGKELKEIIIEASQSETKPTEDLKSKRGTRLPEDWEISQEWGEWAEKQGLNESEINFQANKFKNHWISTTRNPIKRNWYSTWQNWIFTYLEGKNNGLQKKFG